MICRACGNTLTRGHNGLKCRKCHAWARNAACARDVADLHCCRLSGVASHESQSHSCSQGLGSCAAEGAPRLTQDMEQAMDVQMADVLVADVHGGPQFFSEHVAYRAALQVVPTAFPATLLRPWRSRTSSLCRLIWPHRRQAGRSHRAVRKPRTPQRCSLCLRRSCWSWRRPCRRCILSGTSRGA